MTRNKTTFAVRAEFYDRMVSDTRLSRAALAVSWRLVNHINDSTGECFPSVERLSGQLGVNERTVRRGVDQLIEAGWFTKQQRGRGGTQYFAAYENRAPMSGFTPEGSTGPGGENEHGKQSQNQGLTEVAAGPVEGTGGIDERRAKMSAKDESETRTSVSVKAGNPVQKTRAILSNEPKEEPKIEPIPPVCPPVAVGDSELIEAVALWNELAGKIGLANVQNFSEARRRKLRQRLAECGGLAGWRAALAKIEASPFLTGGGREGWRADFDFMLQAKSFTKIMEGAYDDRPRRGRLSSVQEAFARLDAAEKGVTP